MDYNSISIKPYIKSHLELQREITLIVWAPSPYFFVKSICLAYINMFAKFDENPDIKETKRYGRTDQVPRDSTELTEAVPIVSSVPLPHGTENASITCDYGVF